jgi:ABC-type nitrate/sulfonate/bicarbonate transport system permease component
MRFALRLDPGSVIRLVTLLAVWVLWEGLSRSGLLYAGVVPSSFTVIGKLVGLLLTSELYHHLWITLAEVIAGFLLALVSGLAVGVVLGERRFLGAAAEPYINGLATTPKIVFLPICMLLVGVGPESKTLLGALSAFFPIVLNTMAGMRQVSPVFIKVGRSFNVSTWQMVSKIYLPSLALPIVTGMRLGLGVAIIGVLLAEIKLAQAGLGAFTIEHYNHFRIAEMYALLIIIFALAGVANAALGRLTVRLRGYSVN